MFRSPEISRCPQPAEGYKKPCHPYTDVAEGDIGVAVTVDEWGYVLRGQE